MQSAFYKNGEKIVFFSKLTRTLLTSEKAFFQCGLHGH